MGRQCLASLYHSPCPRRFPHARVDLADRQRSLALLFRALGGASGIALEAASERDLLLRRNLLMRIAGTCKQAPLACCDGNRLRLPSSLAVFPTVALNLELYRWLALLAAHAGPMTHWARDNQRWTWLLLQRYPALLPSYQRLVEAHIALRPDPASLNRAEAALENALRKALREPGSVRQLPRSERAAWPLPLWLYPPLHLDSPQALNDEADDGDDFATPPGEQQGAPKRASRVDDHSRDGGLLVVRLENLFSWSEHVELDRWSDDSHDPDAARVAEDLDHLSLSRQRVRKSGGLKLHLDLPPADVDDIPLGRASNCPNGTTAASACKTASSICKRCNRATPSRSPCRRVYTPRLGACASNLCACAPTASGSASKPKAVSWTCRPGWIFTSSVSTARAPNGVCSWSSVTTIATSRACCWRTCRCPPMRT